MRHPPDNAPRAPRRTPRLLAILALPALLLPGASRGGGGEEPLRLVVWHAYRGAEEKAFEKTARETEAALPGVKLRLLSVPFDAYASKVTNAVPRGHGPDLFVFAHERIGDWARSGVIAPVGACGDPAVGEAYLPGTVEPLCLGGKLYGLPLAFKSLALFSNAAHVAVPPADTAELVARAKAWTDPAASRYGLVWQTDEFYHAVPFLTGFGGGIRDAAGAYRLDTPQNARALEFIRDLLRAERIVPEEATGSLVAGLFRDGKALFAINGPWFVGEIVGGAPFRVSALPRVSETGKPMRPFLTVEGILLSARSAHRGEALAAARLLAGDGSAATRLAEGFQCVANRGVAGKPGALAGRAAVLEGFYRQLPDTIPMPNDPAMRSVWEPARLALGKVVRGEADGAPALALAQRLFRSYTAPPPAPASPSLFIVVAGLSAAGALVLGLRAWRAGDCTRRARRARHAYLYLLPGMAASAALVFLPFVVGASVSLFSHVEGTFTFVGLRNFARVLASPEFAVFEPMNFWTTLMVTVLWTAANVALHVTLGVGAALLLERPWAVLRPLYRVLLIVPWAIPNYITALVWKGMFHRQLGAINALLGLLGVEPVGWFSRFPTAFAANLVTNAWLGFPFMMVVTLGALQAIPRDVEESARVDGAGPWTVFRRIKLPLLKPALLPAVLLGTIWTFNMFNVVYLVSGGEPGGATDILISEAYRWAFERHEQYGYAAAYAVLIFGILLLMSRVQDRLLGSARDA